MRSVVLRPNPHRMHTRKLDRFSFDVACVQCGYSHSHQQVPFACVARARPVWMRPEDTDVSTPGKYSLIMPNKRDVVHSLVTAGIELPASLLGPVSVMEKPRCTVCSYGITH